MAILFLIIPLIVLVFSAILHEIAHGYIADLLGDPTARISGRLTLNPLPHIDIYTTILMPLLLWISTQGQFIIGGAKPVPVDPFNLKKGRRDLALVSLAGPLTNLILAGLGIILIHVFFPKSNLETVLNTSLFGLIIGNLVHINIILGIFNLIPIPPLDGSKLIAMFLPKKEAYTYLSIGQLGTFIIVFLFLFPLGPFSLQDLLLYLYSFILTSFGL